jgi:hypothetical protein
MNWYATQETWIRVVPIPWMLVQMGVLLWQSKVVARLPLYVVAALSAVAAPLIIIAMTLFNVSILGIDGPEPAQSITQVVNFGDALITAAVTMGVLWLLKRIQKLSMPSDDKSVAAST